MRFGHFYMTRTGSLIFQVWLHGVSVSTTNNSALCRWTVADGIEILAREGDVAPGAGGNYGAFQVFSVSSGGAVALQSTLGTNVPLMRALPDDDLSFVVKTGQTVLFNGLNRRILSLGIYQAGASSGGGGLGAGINDAGEVFTVLSLGGQDYVARFYR